MLSPRTTTIRSAPVTDLADRTIAALSSVGLRGPLNIQLFLSDPPVLIEVNTRFLELLGYADRGELIGRTVSDIGIWASAAEVEQVAADLRQRRFIREARVSFRTRSGQPSRALAALQEIEVGGQECMLALFWRM